MIFMQNVLITRKLLSFFEENIDDWICRKRSKNSLSRAQNVRWQSWLNINFMNYFNHCRFSWNSGKIEQWILSLNDILTFIWLNWHHALIILTLAYQIREQYFVESKNFTLYSLAEILDVLIASLRYCNKKTS